MRILFINSIQMYGGGEVWMVTAARELLRRGHHVWLMCRPDAELVLHAAKAAIPYIPIRIRGDFDPRTILKMKRFLQRQQIDVVLTNMDKELRLAALAARLCHRPPVFARKGIDRPLKNCLRYRWTYNRLATAIIANSQATKQTLLSSAPWLREERVYVIYNGINPERYTPGRVMSIRDKLGIPARAKVVGFVGRLNVQKGIRYLLEAFKRIAPVVPDAHLLLVGEGDLQEMVRNFISENRLDGRIHMAGFRSDIADVMYSLDVFVLPSLWEGFGIVLIEAMAAGKPCVTTAVSSMPEIVRHQESGLVVPDKDSEALARAIQELVIDDDRAVVMGEQGKQIVRQNFTLEKMIDQYEQLFKQYL